MQSKHKADRLVREMSLASRLWAQTAVGQLSRQAVAYSGSAHVLHARDHNSEGLVVPLAATPQCQWGKALSVHYSWTALAALCCSSFRSSFWLCDMGRSWVMSCLKPMILTVSTDSEAQQNSWFRAGPGCVSTGDGAPGSHLRTVLHLYLGCVHTFPYQLCVASIVFFFLFVATRQA